MPEKIKFALFWTTWALVAGEIPKFSTLPPFHDLTDLGLVVHRKSFAFLPHRDGLQAKASKQRLQCGSQRTCRVNAGLCPHRDGENWTRLTGCHALSLNADALCGRRWRCLRFQFRTAHFLRALARGLVPSARGLVPVARLLMGFSLRVPARP
jgi:hypothetical protein